MVLYPSYNGYHSLGFPHVSDHTKGHRATSCRKTTQSSESENGAKVRRNAYRNLPDVDKEQTELEDGPSSQLLAPGL